MENWRDPQPFLIQIKLDILQASIWKRYLSRDDSDKVTIYNIARMASEENDSRMRDYNDDEEAITQYKERSEVLRLRKDSIGSTTYLVLIQLQWLQR